MFMKSTVVYIILFLSFFLSKPTMAQYTQGKESLIAPSPTVAALAKFGQIPVGYNTGIPNISIPLYTLKCGNLTLPISLDYHAGGIRVNDVASWVGLGWSLNSGGAINIAVQGGKDSYPRINMIPMDELESTAPYTQADLQDFMAGPDTEPDIYNYQLGPYAGQFMVDLRDNNSTAYNVNGSKEITFDIINLGPSLALYAKDQFGTRYTFESVQEQTSNTTEYYRYSFSTNSFTTYPDLHFYGSTITTAVPLSKLVNANKTDSIVFSYNRMYEDYYSQMNGSICWGMSSSRTGWTEYINPFPNHSRMHPYPDNYSRVKKQSMTRKVSTILASNGIRIVLTATTNRNDLNNLSTSNEWEKAKSLDKIEIYDANNNLIKKWEFIYDYFVSYITNPNDNATNYRLKLTGLREYGATSANPQIYAFNYYGDAPGEPQLPFRNSYSGQDYWGYCNKLVAANDAVNFKKAFPNISNFSFTQWYRNNNQSTSDYISISYTEGESKEPNADFLSAGSLKQITYPTGGSAAFEYESNVSSFMYADPNWTNRMGGGQRIKKITSNPLTGTPVVQQYQYTDENGNSTGEITNVPRPARQKVWQITGQQHLAAPYYSYLASFDQSYVELKSDCSTPLYTSIGSVLTYNSVTETGLEGKTVYNYFKREDNDTYVVFHEEFSNMLGMDVAPNGYEGFIPYMDNLEGIWNQFINRVDERQTEDRGYWGTYYKHGVLKRKEVYNNNNQLVFDESYAYKDLGQKKLTGLRVYQNPDISSLRSTTATTHGTLSPTNFYNTYTTLVGLCQLAGKSITQYDVNGANPITTQEEYTYNDDNLLVQTKSTNSLNEIITITNRYPSDINTGIYSVMKQRNMLNYPIEIIKKKNNLVTGSALNTYQQVNGVSNFAMFLPAKNYQSKLTSPAASFTPFNGTVQDPSYQSLPDREYSSYNVYGNTREIKRRDGITTSYLWGYNNMYPVAEITGSDYATASSYITQSVLDAATGNGDDAALQTHLNNLRNIPNALVTTYTYKPLVGMTSQTDVNGRTTYYQYDGFGRLALIRDKDNNILKKFCYNYKGQQEQCSEFGSAAIDNYYYSQNCGSQTPVAYYVSVPQGMFTSTSSQAEADAQAQQYAQNQANQYGSCQAADISLTYNNYNGTTFYIELYNTGTGQSYWFTAYQYNSGLLGNVPEGTYDIYITPDQNWWTYFSHYVGCGSYNAGYNTVSFYGVSLNASCNNFEMYY
jgi:YD repeat-containing protein